MRVCSNDVRRRSDTRTLHDAGGDGALCGDDLSILGAVRMSAEVVDHPVINFIWKVEQSHLVEQDPMADSVKGLAEIQSDNSNEVIAVEE